MQSLKEKQGKKKCKRGIVMGINSVVDGHVHYMKTISSYILKQTWCLFVYVLVTDFHGLRPRQPLWGRVRCHSLLYIQCGCVMQFGIKRCTQQAKRRCTGHDGQAKPAWAACTGPAGAPQASNTLIYMHYGQAHC
jgi:hypothetical protein